jgi:hypothetical protein
MESFKYRFFALILSLSTSTIYAEVSAQGVKNSPSIKQDVTPAENVSKSAVASEQSASAGEDAWQLSAEQWEFARTGEAMLSSAVLKQVIKAWLSEKNKIIEIQYPGGEDGEFWVQELSDRLVSLGIPSESMIAVPGSGADDMIQFNLVNGR